MTLAYAWLINKSYTPSVPVISIRMGSGTKVRKVDEMMGPLMCKISVGLVKWWNLLIFNV